MDWSEHVVQWCHPTSLSHMFPCCRSRSESCSASSSKACREKLRRDRLNDKYSHILLHPFLSLSLCVPLLGTHSLYLECLQGLWNWALSWILGELPKRTRLLFWLMLSALWLSYEVKPRSWRTQIQVFKRRLKSWRSIDIYALPILFFIVMDFWALVIYLCVWFLPFASYPAT